MSTYYVDNVTGDDTNLGTSEGSGNAWATIDHAMQSLGQGDKIWVKGGSDYTENATIVLAGQSWTPKMIFEGYTGITGDGGKFVIDATGLTNGITGGASIYYNFYNMDIKNATGDGFGAVLGDEAKFVNCGFYDNGGCGILCDNFIVLYNCVATGNTLDGIHCGGGVAVSCIASDNLQDGIWMDGYHGPVVDSCLSVNNGRYGIHMSNGGPVTNCTVDGKGVTQIGIHFPIEYRATTAYNNIVVGCDVGLQSFRDYDVHMIAMNNLLYDNVSDYNLWAEENKDGDVLADPLFTDRTNRDYTLTKASPARNAGFNMGGGLGVDIGSYKSNFPSRLIITG